MIHVVLGGTDDAENAKDHLQRDAEVDVLTEYGNHQEAGPEHEAPVHIVCEEPDEVDLDPLVSTLLNVKALQSQRLLEQYESVEYLVPQRFKDQKDEY